jgi:hypothetical protein
VKFLEVKRIEAKERQLISDGLTPAQKLAKLDAAFGTGQGAAKERAKLAKLLATPNAVQESGSSAVKKGKKKTTAEE